MNRLKPSLRNLRTYLCHHHAASMKQISQDFAEDAQALLPMLEYWVRKGSVRMQMKTSACQKSCSLCDPLDTQWFIWIADSVGSTIDVCPKEHAKMLKRCRDLDARML